MTLVAPSPWVDVAKAVAAQAIVWHHLAFYGPMADVAWPLAPALFECLAHHARMAVQVFLVVGGYLAALQWAPRMRWREGVGLWPTLQRRYLRLLLPYAVMLGLAIAASALARMVVDHPSISGPASVGQVVAHLALMQDVLGVPALSAGVWYVSIDFQLFVLFILLLWATRSAASNAWALGAVVALCAMSLLAFNRHSDWDAYAIYFFGAYGLGILSAWWVQFQRPWLPLVLTLALVATALFVEWRARIAVASVTALALGLLAQRTWRDGPLRALVRYLSQTSYALFLIHFPVCLLVNAAFTRWASSTPVVQLWGLIVAWLVSMVAANAFHRTIERPSLRWLARWRVEPSIPGRVQLTVRRTDE